ncbi:MAG: transcription termination factor Rho [Prevotella sp.]|nr:transcription termination factor Rho [Prevotella sp.]
MIKEEDLFSAEENAEPQKRKRTRITKKDTSDHVYSVTGLEGGTLEKPKRKRGRPSKAEKEAMLLAQLEMEKGATDNVVVTSNEINDNAEDMTDNNAEAHEGVSEDALVNGEQTEGEEQAATEGDEIADAVDAPKRKRLRKTKEEIIAAAEARAEVLAQTNHLRATGNTETVTEEENQQDGNNPDFVPEEKYSNTEATAEEKEEMQPGLLEQLQNKVSQRKEEGEDDVWEDDPGDGTDFIIINDLPVEDNAAIPYYDMLDNPQVAVTPMMEYQSVDNVVSEPQYEFADIIEANGLLEIMPDGYGFLRSSDYNYLSSPDDVHLTAQQIKQYSLKMGDVVECRVRPPRIGEKYFTMSSIVRVNGRNPDDIRDRISFENLTPLFPDEKFNLCGTPSATNISTRIVDLFSPIGKGQRSLIVAQPKTGKTILMKDIANAIAANHPEAYIMMLLIDERPEEVTDMARTVNAEVIASTFDEPADRHVKIAGLVLEKAKRLVECGHDVVIFLDSITRLARAYNTVAPASGKVLTGGVDANALQKPKRFFGAARNIEGGGSLTIIATALTDTGSKMDEVIFEEFKGTGNSELQLDRQLANKRIFPAVNLVASSTRRDDLLLDEMTINRMWILRKHIADMNAMEAMNDIHNILLHTRNNEEFLASMNR